ncbi:hypothetical protein NVP1046O_70 [Vibrio phage 1.046.O._10N.286.52.E3]|nr:hypothetical protein NVP1046O_70 [Vibrio phage 1.046.O._10N.286.52.E3]
MSTLTGKKFHEGNPYTEELDVHIVKTVVSQNDRAVRFDDSSSARVVNSEVVNHVPSV